jgi:hypothetical protein
MIDVILLESALAQTGEWQAMMKRCHGSSRSKMCSKDGTSSGKSSFVLCGTRDHDGGSGGLLGPYNDKPATKKHAVLSDHHTYPPSKAFQLLKLLTVDSNGASALNWAIRTLTAASLASCLHIS